MKLTQRDKKLLIGLAVFIFAVVFIKFIFLPKMNNISTLKLDIAELNNTYTMNMAYKTKSESLDSDIKILSERLKKLREVYPPSINCDELLIIIHGLIRDSDMEIASMSFESPKEVTLQADQAKTDVTAAGQSPDQAAAGTQESGQNQGIDQILNGGMNAASGILNYFYLWGLTGQQGQINPEAAVIPDGKGYDVTVKLDGQGTNGQIKKFLSNITKLKNVAYCKNLNITGQNAVQASEEENQLRFTAELQFFGIMDKGAGEYYLLEDGKWIPVPAAGKTDIFSAYEGFSAGEAAYSSAETGDGTSKEDGGSGEEDKSGNYDFSVISSAFGGGLAPSVSISCKNPESKENYASPIVYGDNRGIENAEIYIEQKGGKYFCKFKTDHEAYPDRQYNETFEFIPTGKDLNVRILSFPRTGEEDKSGINLTIENKSDKNLIYHIENDDPKLPRVNIVKTTGSVNNEKN